MKVFLFLGLIISATLAQAQAKAMFDSCTVQAQSASASKESFGVIFGYGNLRTVYYRCSIVSGAKYTTANDGSVMVQETTLFSSECGRFSNHFSQSKAALKALQKQNVCPL